LFVFFNYIIGNRSYSRFRDNSW